MKLELFHSAASLCSQKVRLCLAEKGLEWTSHHLVLRNFEQTSPEFLRLNPDGCVPVLLADGQPIRESSVINEFLEDHFDAPPLRPADPLGRARVREWTLYITCEPAQAVKAASFHKLVAPAVRGTRSEAETAAIAARIPIQATASRWVKALTTGFSEAEVDEALRRLRATLDRMERALGASAWLAGDAYTLADVEMTPFVNWHVIAGEDRAIRERPRVAAWYEAVKARPSFVRAIGWRP